MKSVLFLIPLTSNGITVNNGDFDKSHWNTNGKYWFTTYIPETFSLGIVPVNIKNYFLGNSTVTHEIEEGQHIFVGISSLKFFC